MFTTLNSKLKRMLSVVLALSMVLSPIMALAEEVGEAVATALEEPVAVVFAASDFQPRMLNGKVTSGATKGAVNYTNNRNIAAGVEQMELIADRVLKDYPNITGALFGGDYSNESKYRYDYNYSNNANITIDGMNAVRYVYGKKFGLSQEEIVMIQGNHDYYVSPLATTNAHDTEDYGVYAISEKDFMYKQANLANGLDTIKKTAEELDRYLQAKVAQHYTKPIFILNHVPLHHNPRAEDNLYSQYLFDVINRAGGQGLKIFYLFGHNHSKGYDAHIGEAAIYLKPGEVMYIPDPNTFNNPTTGGAYSLKRTLNFSYMNAGYVGYVTTDSTGYADNTLTGTVFAIYENRVEVKRYDANGQHVLKAAGKALTTFENHYLYLYDHSIVSDTVLLNDKFNVTLNTDNLYPKSSVTSEKATKITYNEGANADGYYATGSGSQKVTLEESNKTVSVPVAENFKVGSTGKIGIDYIAEQYKIKSVTSSKPGVATAGLEKGEVTVTGIAPGKTTLTIVAEHVGGVKGDVSLTYDLVVFPDSTKPLYYTRYKLLNAVDPKQLNSAVTASVFATSNHNDSDNAFVAGETYIFVDSRQSKTRIYGLKNDDYKEEPERWSYALLDGPSGSTVSSRNVAVYGGGSSTEVTKSGKTATVYTGTYVDVVDEYAEWVYCGSGKYLRNAATGLFLTSEVGKTTGDIILSGNCPVDADGNGSTTNDYNAWAIGAYGVFINDGDGEGSGNTGTNYRRYMRFSLDHTSYATKFSTEVDNSSGAQQYSNICIYKKVQNGSNLTGETAWLDTTKISVFKGDINGETGATMYISDGMSVTPVPVTLNMLYSGTANITTNAVSSVGSTIATNFKLKYDTVDIATGISVTVREKPTWNHIANQKIKIGGTVSVAQTVTMPGATNVTYTYESLNVACATVSSDGTVTGTGVGGADIRITATATYSDGSTLSTSDEVYVTVTPDSSVACFNEVRAFGKKSVYKLVEDGGLDGAKYTYTGEGTDKGTIDGADEFLIVSSDVAGNAFAMKYDMGNLNNLNAVPVTIESHNGEKFIDTSDSNLRWELTQSINGNTKSSTVFTKGTPANNTDGFHFPSANYYYLDSKSKDGLQFLIALTNLDNGTYDGSQTIDCDTNLFNTQGGDSYVKGAINVAYPLGENKYMNPAFAWNYAQTGIGFAAINYNPYYYGATVDPQVEDRFTKGTNLFRNFTYVLTYDEAMGQFKAVLHNEKLENNGTWPGNLKNEYLAQGGYPGRVYAYAKKNIETPGIIIWISDKNEGTVPYNATSGATTGAMINITTHGPEGVTTVSEPLTYGMLSKDGMTTAVTADTTYEGVTVKYTYNSTEYTICNKFKLNVKNLSDNYPDYPEQGSVNTNKTLDTSKYAYKGTGVSHIDLTASGIPVSNGIDIVVMIDASTSMQDAVGGNKKTRLQMLYEALVELMNSLKTPDENGKLSDVEVAIASFNGQTYLDKNHLMSPLNPICDCGKTHNKGYVHYNAVDMSAVNLPFADIADPSYDAFIKSLQYDIKNSYFGRNDAAAGKICNVKTIKPSSGTNYDRAMELTYDLLLAKQAQNSARGENRKQYVLFMTDGETWQYNYFGGRNYNEENYIANGHGYIYHDANHKSKWMYLLDGALDTDNKMFAADANLAATVWNTNTGDTTPVVEDIGNNQALFRKYYNPEGKHWTAEAIKGNPAEKYMIIDPESQKEDNIEYVNGLGATMYTIAFTIGNEPDRGIQRSVTEGVIKRMATDEDHFTSVDTNTNAYSNLVKAFMQLKNEIKSSGNAMYTDQMGDDFDLQMRTDFTVDGKTYHLDPAPTITLTSYPLYKYWEAGTVVDGVKVSQDMVGKRKSNTGTEMEKIWFNSDGSQAFSTLIDNGTKNILSDGVIKGKNVWYNTDSSAYTVTADDVALAPLLTVNQKLEPETFYWMIGDVPEDEYVLGYDVYLEGSMEATALAGQHNTNNFAKLTYINHLGNECYKDVSSPKLPWDEAYVGVGFYFVNEQGQPLVNRKTGKTGSFEASQKLPDIQYYNFKLNESETVDREIIAQSVLPAGYTLYDESAKYTVFAASSYEYNPHWEIVKGDVPVASTYVTQIGSSATSSNKLNETSDKITYTNTIVYFAIVGSVNAVPDTVVIDYALPVDINVMTNDVLFAGDAHLEAVGFNEDSYTLEGKEEHRAQLLTGFSDTYDGCKFGTASIEGEKVRYTPTNKKSMEFNDKEVFTYAAHYDGDSAVQGHYYADVTIIPATTVYYEENFVTFRVYDLKGDDGKPGYLEGEGNSTAQWKNTTGSHYGLSQNEDRPGNLSQNDANNIYGYDSAYNSYGASTYPYSMGVGKIFTAKADDTMPQVGGKPTGRYEGEASFTFYGTGFDLISVTSKNTGVIFVRVYTVDENGTENFYKSSLVDTYYGYSYDSETGEWKDADSKASIYQVPVIKMEGLPYDKYKVYMTVSYTGILDHGTNTPTSYQFILDSIRIYDPANNGANDKVIENTYIKDNEGWPVYQEVRNLLISKESFGSLTAGGVTAGTVFIDGRGKYSGDTVDDVFNITDYINYGPNNEVYLQKNQAIAFELDKSNVAAIHLAMKTMSKYAAKVRIFNAVTDSSGNVQIKNEITKTIGTCTDLYYDISKLNGGTVVIANVSTNSSILSLTNFKFTYASEEDRDASNSRGSVLSVTKQAGYQAVAGLKKVSMPWLDVEVGETHTFVPEQFDASVSKTEVRQGSTVTVTVNTNADVDHITINGVEVTKYTKSWFTAERQWKYTIRIDEAGDTPITVVAYNADGEASAELTNTVSATERVNLKSTANGSMLDRMYSGWIETLSAKAN